MWYGVLFQSSQETMTDGLRVHYIEVDAFPNVFLALGELHFS